MIAPLVASVRERNRADPSRRRFSVLCWRGWCDYEFMIRDVALLASFVTVTAFPPVTDLPRRECPSPETCQCVCHDVECALRARLGEK